MKIHVFPPSGRVVDIVALENYLALDCELKPIALGRGDQRATRRRDRQGAHGLYRSMMLIVFAESPPGRA